jgi:hypothetical protein
MRFRAAGAMMVVTAGLLAASSAHAYPSAVVFAPTAESKPFGKVSAFAYGASVLSPAPKTFAVAPWFGVQAGVMPSIALGNGIALGGAELGIDALGPGDGTYKPVLNGKLSLLKQVGWVPSVGVGFMQFAPTRARRSLDMGYVSLTETLVLGARKTNLGSFTAGYARSFARRAAEGAEPVFHGTFPFSFDDRSAVVLGYCSPSLGIFSIGLEHVGGYSEMSGTTAGLFATPLDWLYVAAGVLFGNDRSAAYRADAVFTMVGVDLHLLRQKPSTNATAARDVRRLHGAL